MWTQRSRNLLVGSDPSDCFVGDFAIDGVVQTCILLSLKLAGAKICMINMAMCLDTAREMVHVCLHDMVTAPVRSLNLKLLTRSSIWSPHSKQRVNNLQTSEIFSM